MVELLPSFIMPNDPAVDRLLKATSEVLRSEGKNDALDGYESRSTTGNIHKFTKWYQPE